MLRFYTEWRIGAQIWSFIGDGFILIATSYLCWVFPCKFELFYGNFG